jgi:hypothetical protein
VLHHLPARPFAESQENGVGRHIVMWCLMGVLAQRAQRETDPKGSGRVLERAQTQMRARLGAGGFFRCPGIVDCLFPRWIIYEKFWPHVVENVAVERHGRRALLLIQRPDVEHLAPLLGNEDWGQILMMRCPWAVA